MPLDEFAAAVAATDLLVTVDTMAAHCAGALGHPVWLMLPLSPHWCWGIGRGQTPWYPTAAVPPGRPAGLVESTRGRRGRAPFVIN
jgi:ADP-heptose:LPS heptosyltransferase